jgi:hypothetical protein
VQWPLLLLLLLATPLYPWLLLGQEVWGRVCQQCEPLAQLLLRYLRHCRPSCCANSSSSSMV